MGRYALGRYGGMSVGRGVTNQPSQALPSLTDVGAPPPAQRTWYQPFLGFLDWMNGFSRIGTQAMATAERGLTQGSWDADFNWWKYENEDDPHDALGLGWLSGAASGAGLGFVAGGPVGAAVGGAIGLGAGLLAPLLPDTPAQAATFLREKADRSNLVVNVFGNDMKPAEALPWLAGLWNEHTAAEMLNDPLNLVEALGIGGKIAGGLGDLAKGANKSLSHSIPAYASLAKWADTQFIGTTHRNVARAARETANAPQYQIDNMAIEMEEMLRPVVDSVGGDSFVKINDLLEKTEELHIIAPEAARAAMDDILTPHTTGGYQFAPQQLDVTADMPTAYRQSVLQGGAERLDWAKRTARENFPDVPESIQDTIAHFMTRSMNTYANAQAIENLKGIPTQVLGDNQYVMHMLSSAAAKARNKSTVRTAGEMLAEQIIDKPTIKNVIGQSATQTLHRRDLRADIVTLNKAAREGKMGFVDGKLVILDGETPKGFVPLKGDLFTEDPAALLMARTARGLNAVNSIDFFDQAAVQFGEVLEAGGTIRKGSKSIPDILKGGEKGADWTRTFGKLDETVQNRIRNTYFDDEATAQAVIRQFQAMRAIERKPGPIMRFLGRYRRIWGALTLSPFAPYHMRNAMGGAIVNEMEFGAASIMYNIEAAFGMNKKGSKYWDEFRQLGGSGRGQLSTIFNRSEDFAHITPLAGTMLESKWKKAANTLGNPFYDTGRRGVGREFLGKTVGQAVEDQQRFAAFVGYRRQGKSAADAMKGAARLHFDYQDIPRWLEESRPALAFPTWSLKQIPLQVEFMFTRPTRFAQRGRFIQHSMEAAGMDPEKTPDFIREGGGFAIPGMDPDKPMWFRPENFDPVAVLSEISDPIRWGYQMLNPLVTTLPEQLTAARKIPIRGGPSDWSPTAPFGRGAENVGFDPFFERPIVNTYKEFNEAIPLVGGTKMPAWMQRADHVARSFLRHYTEFSGGFKMIQKNSKQQEGYVETFARKVAGVPMYWQEMNTSIYFNLRNIDKEIGAELGKSTSDGNALKDLYTRRLALLAHGTFAQQDPFNPEQLRHWRDYGTEESEFDIAGKKQMWQQAIESCWMLLTGQKTPTSERVYDMPELDETESEYIEALLHRLLDTYTIEVGNAVARGELNDSGNPLSYRSETGYARERQEALGGRQ